LREDEFAAAAIDLPPADLRDIAEAEELQLTSNEQAGFAFRD
jgi:hypothetical protein